MMLDVHGDTQGLGRATKEKPWVHWLKVNVEGLDYKNTGDQMVRFRGTVVEADHVILVFKQQGRISITDGEYNGARDTCFAGFW